MKCRGCYSSKVSLVLSLGNQHLSDFINEDAKLEKYPLDLIVCEDCGLVQLQKTPPLAKMYNDHYGYRSGVNQTMRDELTQIVQSATKLVVLQSKDIVVDIGANDGTLLENYDKSLIKIAVEPIKKLARECSLHADFVVNDFFNLKSYIKVLPKNFDHKAKIVTAISMFYDLEDPNEFVSDVSKILDKNGIFIIQQNYLLGMLNQNAFDNIVHEHIEYYSLSSLEHLLDKHNLEVFDVEVKDLNGGSFRTYICHKGSRVKHNRKNTVAMRNVEKNARLHQKETYKAFRDRVNENKKQLVKFVKRKVKAGKSIYIYGASTRGNTMIQYYQLNNKLIKAAVERNPEKWGKKIASLNIPIISEAQARAEKPDYLLVLPWFFKEEFLKREAGYLRNGGHFIFPLPKFEVI